MIITHVEKNRVYTIDGISAYDIYKKYLGEETAQQLPAIGIEYPLVIKKDGKSIARAVLARHDDGSLSFAGDLSNGDIVHFGYGDTALFCSLTKETAKSTRRSYLRLFVHGKTPFYARS